MEDPEYKYLPAYILPLGLEKKTVVHPLKVYQGPLATFPPYSFVAFHKRQEIRKKHASVSKTIWYSIKNLTCCGGTPISAKADSKNCFAGFPTTSAWTSQAYWKRKKERQTHKKCWSEKDLFNFTTLVNCINSMWLLTFALKYYNGLAGEEEYWKIWITEVLNTLWQERKSSWKISSSKPFTFSITKALFRLSSSIAHFC